MSLPTLGATDLRIVVHFARIQTLASDGVRLGKESATSRGWRSIGGKDCFASTEYLNATGYVAPSKWECAPCPAGADCRSSLIAEEIKAKFGWWRCHGSLTFASCLGAACLGGPNPLLAGKHFRSTVNSTGAADPDDNGLAGSDAVDLALVDSVNETCAQGHANPPINNTRCSSCAVNYALSGDGSGRCVECGGAGGSMALFLLTVLGVVVLFVLLIAVKMRSTGKKKAEHSTMKRILLTHLQMISIVLSLNVSWPTTVRTFLSLASSLASISAQAASIQCSFGDDQSSNAEVYYGMLIATAILPLVLMCVTTIFWFVLLPLVGMHKCLTCGKKIVYQPCIPTKNPFRRRKKKKKPTRSERLPTLIGSGGGGGGGSSSSTTLRSTRDGWITTNLLLVYILYPSCVKMSFGVWRRTSVCGTYFWSLNDAVPFDSERHNEMKAVAAAVLILYGLVFPFSAWFYIFQHKDRQTNDKLVFRFGLLFSGFAPHFYWWELVIFLRKLAFIILVNFGSSHKQQLHIALGLIIVLAACQERAKPFDGADSKESNRRLHLLEMSSLFILLFMIWSATFFDISRCDANDEFCGMLGVFVIGTNSMFVLACTFVMFRSFSERNQLGKKHGNIRSRLSVFAPGEISEAAANELGGGGGGERAVSIKQRRSSAFHLKFFPEEEHDNDDREHRSGGGHSRVSSINPLSGGKTREEFANGRRDVSDVVAEIEMVSNPMKKEEEEETTTRSAV